MWPWLARIIHQLKYAILSQKNPPCQQRASHWFYLFVWFSSPGLWKGNCTERTEHHFNAIITFSVHVDHSLHKVQTYKMAEMNSGEFCPKTYNITLASHVTTHSSGENHYECDQCKKTFYQTGSLKNHKLTHSGEKLHKCVQCSKSFPYASKLRNHMIIHTGEKLYKCAQCSKSFISGAHLKSHMFTHYRKKFQICAQCGVIKSSWTLEITLVHPFWGEAAQVCTMQLLMHSR